MPFISDHAFIVLFNLSFCHLKIFLFGIFFCYKSFFQDIQGCVIITRNNIYVLHLHRRIHHSKQKDGMFFFPKLFSVSRLQI